MPSRTVDFDQLHTIREVAADLGVSTQYLYRLIKQGRLPNIESPLGRLIPADAVEALRKEREAKNAA